jgi:hypothetical protein
VDEGLDKALAAVKAATSEGTTSDNNES